MVGSIAAPRRQHGSECLLPRGNAAAVRCAPCVPAAVSGCVLHQDSFDTGRNLQRVRVSARLAAHEGALDDGDELPALEGPVLVEETELGQKGPARVREQRGPNSHPGTIAARPVSVGV